MLIGRPDTLEPRDLEILLNRSRCPVVTMPPLSPYSLCRVLHHIKVLQPQQLLSAPG
jgi:hypothetical protein